MNIPLWLLRLLGRAPQIAAQAEELLPALLESGALESGPVLEGFADEAMPAPPVNEAVLPGPDLPAQLQWVFDPLPPIRPEELTERGSSSGRPMEPTSRLPIRELDIPDEELTADEMARPWTYFRSSNVYGFSWRKGTLEVSFLPPELRVQGKHGWATADELDAAPIMNLRPDEYMSLKESYAPGSIYEYYAVPAAVYWYFRAAPSKGKFVWRWLRDRYAYARIN
jgi:hypothetical protein